MARSPTSASGSGDAVATLPANAGDTAAPPDREQAPDDALPDDLALSTAADAMTAVPASTGAVYTVNARSGLNLRSGPGTDFPVVRTLPFGTRLQVLKREGGWGLADLQGDGAADGHVLLAFLREAGASPPPPAAAQARDFVPLNRRILQDIMNRCGGMTIRSSLNLDQVSDALNRAMLLAEAGTRLREVAFLSQSVIETDYFRTFEEYGRGRGKAYAPYYGRGMHQLTWKDTYAACSKAVFGDDRLIRNPDLIIDDLEVNIKITAWYWRDHKPFNRLADAEDIDEIIHLLYGGRITSPKPNVRKSVLLRRSFYTTIASVLREAAAP